MAARTEDDTYHGGTHTFAKAPVLPTGTVKNANVATDAAIAASKLQHQHVIPYSQPNTAASAETRVVHRVYGASGTIVSFHAGSIAKAVGDSTVTVDLKKNGTTCLSGVITLDNANTNRVAEAGTLSVTALAAGDVLEIVTTATTGTGTLPTGLFASIVTNEDAQ